MRISDTKKRNFNSGF